MEYYRLNLKFDILGVDLLKPIAIIRDMATTTTTNESKKMNYQATDTLGNVFTITVKENGNVISRNGNGIHTCLSNYCHVGNGYQEQSKNMREAARLGVDHLNAISTRTWKAI